MRTQHMHVQVVEVLQPAGKSWPVASVYLPVVTRLGRTMSLNARQRLLDKPI